MPGERVESSRAGLGPRDYFSPGFTDLVGERGSVSGTLIIFLSQSGSLLWVRKGEGSGEEGRRTGEVQGAQGIWRRNREPAGEEEDL